MLEIKKSYLIGAYAPNMGEAAAKELIEGKISEANLGDRESYTRVETARICGELMREGSLIKIVAQNLLVQLEQRERDELEEVIGARTAELTEANRELKQAKEHFQTLFSVMVDPVVIVNGEGVLVEVTDRVEEVSGVTKEELLGRSFLEIETIAEESKAIIAENLVKRLKGLDVAPYEIEVLTKDGEKLPYEVNAARINYMGQTADMVIFRDIAERKNLEQKLQHAFDKLKESYEELSTPVIQAWGGVLMLPIIGVLDSERVKRLMDVMLQKIVDTRSKVVIIDVTGVRSLDSGVAGHLIKTVQAAGLLGAECIITGISPAVAHATIRLGVEDKLTTRGSLQDGLRYALKLVGVN